MKFNFKLLFFVAGIGLVALFGHVPTALATTSTVCASGCNYTTLGTAFVSSTAGDTIVVSSTYSPNIDASSAISQPASITVDCQNSGAVIGNSTSSVVNYTLATSTVINRCNLTNVNFITGASSTISNNAFSTSTYNHIDLVGSSSTISNNTNIQSLVFDGAGNNTVASNTFSFYNRTGVNPIDNYAVALYQNSGGLFASNTVSSYFTTSTQLVYVFHSTNSTVSGNTVGYASSVASIPTSTYGLTRIEDSTNILFQYNVVSSISASDSYVEMLRVVAGSAATTATVQNNTFNMVGGNHVGVMLRGPFALTLTMQYNIIYNRTRDGADGIYATKDGGSTTFSVTNDYNGIYGFGNNVTTAGGASVTLGSNSIYNDPNFRTADASTTNDLQLAPFSLYLDINGTNDIGANSGTRGSTFTIDDNGTVDYSSVHGTSTAAINASMKTGDTYNLLAGTYSAFSVSTSTYATSSITFSGVGVTTIINNTSSSTNAILLTGLANSTMQNLVVQNASSSASTWTLSNSLYSFGGSDYDDSSAVGLGSDNLSLVKSASGSCSVVAYNNAGISTIVGSAINDWHLALVNIGGNKITVWVPNDMNSSAASFTADCSGFGATVDKWVTSTLSVSGGTFTYNSSLVSAASITLKSGSSAPTLTNSITAYAGISIASGDSNNIINVTSTVNYYGVRFTGSAASNTVSSSTLSSSLGYDVYSSATGDNTFQNVNFTRASSSIASTGNVNVKYNARAYVANSGATALAGVPVSFSSADSSQTSSQTTGSDGFTPYIGYKLAFVMSSSSISATNGGYNPYTVTASASSTYSATSTATNLASVNQLFSLTMLASPTAPSSLATSSVATSSISLTWTDNSSNETSFLFDYTSSTFPGTTSSLAINATSTTITGLSPNTSYTFRIAAVGVGGTSSYSTSSAQYTAPNIPGTPTASSNGATSLIVAWSANSNPSGTIFELYNVTTGASVGTTTAASYTVTGLTASTAYQFKVLAQALGSGNSNSSYSSNSTAVSTDAVAAAASSSNSSGGGGALPPIFIIPESIDKTKIMTINNGAPKTISQAVSLTFNSTEAVMMAISEDSSFQSVSFVPAQNSLSFNLSAGKGQKNVYAKLRAKSGAEIIVSDSIELLVEEKPKCALSAGFYRSSTASSVFKINETCLKHLVANRSVLLSYLSSEKLVKKTTTKILSAIKSDKLYYAPWGLNYTPKTGTLIKSTDSGVVYLISGKTKRPFASEKAFLSRKYKWANVQTAVPFVLDRFKTGLPLK